MTKRSRPRKVLIVKLGNTVLKIIDGTSDWKKHIFKWKLLKLDQMIISIESELRRIESIQSNRNAPKNERKNGVNMIRAVSNNK